MKKKTLVPLLVFLMGICLVTLVVYKTDTHEKEQRRTTAQLNATTYGERIKNEIINGIEITDVLKQLLISGTGEINQFDTIAKNIMSDSVESVQPSVVPHTHGILLQSSALQNLLLHSVQTHPEGSVHSWQKKSPT